MHPWSYGNLYHIKDGRHWQNEVSKWGFKHHRDLKNTRRLLWLKHGRASCMLSPDLILFTSMNHHTYIHMINISNLKQYIFQSSMPRLYWPCLHAAQVDRRSQPNTSHLEGLKKTLCFLDDAEHDLLRRLSAGKAIRQRESQHGYCSLLVLYEGGQGGTQRRNSHTGTELSDQPEAELRVNLSGHSHVETEDKMQPFQDYVIFKHSFQSWVNYDFI